MSTSTARELLVALGLRLRAVAASNWGSASGFRYYALRWKAFFIVLVSAVYGVVSLQEIPTYSSAYYKQTKQVHKKQANQVAREGIGTYRRAKLMWQVKHLNGFTLVSSQTRWLAQLLVSDLRDCRKSKPRVRNTGYTYG